MIFYSKKLNEKKNSNKNDRAVLNERNQLAYSKVCSILEYNHII